MTAFDDQTIRVTVPWFTARQLDQLGEERGIRRAEVVAQIVAGALKADVAEALADLADQSPDKSAPGGAT